MIEYFNTCDFLMLYFCGVVFSFFIRFLIITTAALVSQNTRLKEIKNTSKKLSKSVVKYSYFSFAWPIELIFFAYKNIKYLLEK